MHTVTTALRVAACSLALLGSATVRAFADSSTSPTASLVAEPESDQPADLIGRGYFQMSMAGGQQRSVRVIVRNVSTEPISIHSTAVDGVPMTSGGVDFNTSDQPVVGAGTWVSLDTPNLELAPGESRRVTASISVPVNATPGDHVGGISLEDARGRPGTDDSLVVINVSYRRAIAIVVAVPGERTAALDVQGVALSQDARGNRAVVQVRNTGNSLLKAKGTIEIKGDQASAGTQAFSVETLIPSTGAGVVVPLPSLKLAEGTYNAHVTVLAEDGHALANWDGAAAFGASAQAQPTAAPAAEISLLPALAAPVAAAAVDNQSSSLAPVAALSDQDAAAITRQSTATSSAGFWLLGMLALVLVALRTLASWSSRRSLAANQLRPQPVRSSDDPA